MATGSDLSVPKDPTDRVNLDFQPLLPLSSPAVSKDTLTSGLKDDLKKQFHSPRAAHLDMILLLISLNKVTQKCRMNEIGSQKK